MVAISACAIGERPRAIALLDEEFIYSRGRSVSLAERFSAAFSQPDATLLAAREGKDIVAALMLRPFVWLAARGPRRGAMIGMVCTHRAHRGRGLASALMTEATRLLCAQADFGVLWTTRPEFYGRFGWQSADCGVLGRMRAGGSAPPMPAAEVEALLLRIHSIREARGGERTERSLAGYRTLVPPGVSREAILESGGYAVIGRLEDTAYVYELGGDPAGFAAIERTLAARYRDVYLNLKGGSPAHLWFAARSPVTWTEQSLAMWMPVSGAAGMPSPALCYVPFLDRI